MFETDRSIELLTRRLTWEMDMVGTKAVNEIVLEVPLYLADRELAEKVLTVR